VTAGDQECDPDDDDSAGSETNARRVTHWTLEAGQIIRRPAAA
jgi:hypothetical protein